MTYKKDFDETTYVSFLIKDNELLEKCNEIWEKVKNNLKKEFDSEPVYNERYLKVKIKSYNEKIKYKMIVIKYQKKVFNLFVCL